MKFSNSDGSLFAEVRTVHGEACGTFYEVEKHSQSRGFEKSSAHGTASGAVDAAYEWTQPYVMGMGR